MTIAPELQPLIAAVRALQQLIERFESHGMIIGGVAVGLLGKPRFTQDADAVIFLPIADLEKLIEAAQKEGFSPRYPNAKEFARTRRMIAFRHEPTDVNVDISLGAMPFEAEAIERSQVIQVGNLNLRVPTVEDLIILKAVAHRSKDLMDIESLVEMNPKLDQAHIEDWVKQFAQVLEMPELWTDIEPFLSKKHK